MRYSIEPRDQIYVKGYGFLSFAKNIGKNLSSKYGQKLLDGVKKSVTNAIKAALNRAIHNLNSKIVNDKSDIFFVINSQFQIYSILKIKTSAGHFTVCFSNAVLITLQFVFPMLH